MALYFEQAFLAAPLFHKTAAKDFPVRSDCNNQDYNNRLDSCNHHCNYSHFSSDYIHFPTVPIQEESDAGPQAFGKHGYNRSLSAKDSSDLFRLTG